LKQQRCSASENRSVGGSIPPLGTKRLFLKQIQIVIFGARECAIYSFPRRSGRRGICSGDAGCSSCTFGQTLGTVEMGDASGHLSYGR